MKLNGKYLSVLKSQGVQVLPLTIESLFDLIHDVKMLPDEEIKIFGWLYKSCIAALFFHLLLVALKKRPDLYFMFRHAGLSSNYNGRWTMASGIMVTILSRFATMSIFNSNSSLQNHRRFLFGNRKAIVVPNSVEVLDVKDIEEHGALFRASLGIDDHAVIYGSASRYDAIKNLDYIVTEFLNAQKRMRHDPYLVIIGLDTEKLLEKHKDADLSNVYALGEIPNPQEFFSAIDVHILASSGESFPTVVAESAAHLSHNIITDVGDARMIAPTAQIFELRPGHLASELIRCDQIIATDNYRKNLIVSRAQIISKYSNDRVLNAYHDITGVRFN